MFVTSEEWRSIAPEEWHSHSPRDRSIELVSSDQISTKRFKSELNRVCVESFNAILPDGTGCVYFLALTGSPDVVLRDWITDWITQDMNDYGVLPHHHGEISVSSMFTEYPQQSAAVYHVHKLELHWCIAFAIFPSRVHPFGQDAIFVRKSKYRFNAASEVGLPPLPDLRTEDVFFLQPPCWTVSFEEGEFVNPTDSFPAETRMSEQKTKLDRILSAELLKNFLRDEIWCLLLAFRSLLCGLGYMTRCTPRD